jgi:hypothetical protein
MATLDRTMPVVKGFDLGGDVLVSCSWGTNGASDPATSSFKGDIISSVTYASGVYTLTLREIGYAIISAIACVQTPSDGAGGELVDLYPQIGTIDTSALTVKVKLKTGSTNTAPPASDTNSRINVILVMTQKSIDRRRGA